MLPNASTGSVSTAQRAVVAAAAVAVAAAQANIKKEWTRRNYLLEKELKKLRANVYISAELKHVIYQLLIILISD